MLTFSDRVHKVVAQIPKGKVLSYSEVARRAGSPKAFRVVGSLMKKNHNPKVPCHRVIRASGEVGDYNRGGEKSKINILKKEGVIL